MTEMHRLLEKEKDNRVVERLRFLSLAAKGDYTLEDLAARAGRSRSTIQNWLSKFQDGGLEELLKRDTAPGRVSPLSRPEIQRQLSTAIQSGTLKTAAEIARWLKAKHRIKRSRKSIYYWLKPRMSR